MSKYISLDEARFILERAEKITSNAISLEERYEILLNHVESLPTIDLWEIDKMIEEYNEHTSPSKEYWEWASAAIYALQELKSRLLTK